MAAMGSPGLDTLFAKFDQHVIESGSKPLTGHELEMMAKRDEEKRVAAENANKASSNIIEEED